MSEELAIPRFQLPDAEPCEESLPLHQTWKRRMIAKGLKYKCPKCRKLSKIINVLCDCGAMPKKW